MILVLFGFLVAISLILIFIGLFRPSESAMALLGFIFMFILALYLHSGAVQYETGANITTALSYNGSAIAGITQSTNINYANANDTTTVWVARWLAIGSFIGFVGVLTSVRGWGKK